MKCKDSVFATAGLLFSVARRGEEAEQRASKNTRAGAGEFPSLSREAVLGLGMDEERSCNSTSWILGRRERL